MPLTVGRFPIPYRGVGRTGAPVFAHFLESSEIKKGGGQWVKEDHDQ